MRIDDIKSVQLFNCTDYYKFKRSNNSKVKIKAYRTYYRHYFCRCNYHARIAYRTIYPVWESRLQMCERSRAWPQILSISKYGRQKTRTTVCPSKISGFDQRTSIQLSETKGHNGRNKQYQSRNITQARGIVTSIDGYHQRPFRC